MSYSRFYHYVDAGTCLELIRKDGSEYLLTEAGGRIARKSSQVEPLLTNRERAILINQSFVCRPVHEVAQAFASNQRKVTYKDLRESGLVLLGTQDSRKLFRLTDLSGRNRFTAEGELNVLSVRWGAIPLLLDLGVLAEFVWLREDDSSETRHLFFPEGLDFTPARFKDILDSDIMSHGKPGSWVSLDRISYDMSVRYRIGPARFQRLLENLYMSNKRRYEMARTMEILEYPRARRWVPIFKIEGSVMSHIRLVKP